MPSTLGLRNSVAGSPHEHGWLPVAATWLGAAGLTLPSGVLEQAGLDVREDLLMEVGSDGLRIVADRLRKVYVEITSACNLSCATCIRQTWDERPGHMPVERFERLLNGLPEHRPGLAPIILSLSGFGEPLVHPQFLTLVERARAQGLHVEIITNGILVDNRLASDLAQLGVRQVTVSLDGGDAPAYEAMRGAPHGPALAAVRALAQARRRTQMKVGIAFVVTRRNVRSLPALLQLVDGLSLDFVSLSNVVAHTPEMVADMLWSQAAWATSFNPEGWRPRLTLASLDVNDETREALTALVGRSWVFPPPDIGIGQPRNHCRFVHEGMLAVASDGRVAPCLSLLHTHPEFVNGHWKTVRSFHLGHVEDLPLGEIWRNEVHRGFRSRVRAWEFSPCFACGGCPETDTNESDCYGSQFPSCSECLWAQGLVLCP